MTARRWLLLIAAAVAVLLLVGRALAGAYADYLWYDAIGKAAVWQLRFSALAALHASCALVATAFAFANLYAVRASIVSLVFPRRVGNLEIGEEVPGHRMLGAALTLAILLGLTLAAVQDDWTSFVAASGGVPFGETDPYIGADLGFFVYWLPFESALWNWTFLTVVVISAVVVLLYALTPSLRLEHGSLYLSTYVRRHFTVLLGVLLLLLAWSFRLDMYGLLSDGTGVDGVFGYVDHRVGVPANLILSLTTLAGGVLVIWAGFAGQLRLAGAAVLAIVSLALIGREVAPAIAMHWGTDSERAVLDRPYIATRAGYTRRAFAVDRIRVADSSVAFSSFARAQPWIPVWDPAVIARILGGQPIGARLTWFATGSGIVAEKLSAAPGEGFNRTWSVAHVLGWGADEHGGPIRVDAAGAAEIDEAVLATPRVYPEAAGFVVVPDSTNHVHGTLLSATLTRLAYAWSLQHLRLLFSDLPQPRPTIVTHLDVSDRIARVVPFFAQSRRIDPVVIGETLYWCVDLYSAASTYPLSRHAMLAGDERNYFQHAAVAVVDAATGELTVVADSVLDPIASTWVKRLPSVFSSWNALPPELPRRKPPAIDDVYAEAMAFGRYGTRAGNDIPKRLPVADGADAGLSSDDVPFVLPDSQTLALALPLVDDADRLRGIFVGLGSGEQASVWYPLREPGQTWTAILDRLGSAGASPSASANGVFTRGRVRVIPVRAGAAFLQPIYQRRGDEPPALARMVVLSDTGIHVEPPPTPSLRSSEAPGLPTGADLRGSLADLYRNMRAALHNGDWAAFGRAFDQLGRMIGNHDSLAGAKRP